MIYSRLTIKLSDRSYLFETCAITLHHILHLMDLSIVPKSAQCMHKAFLTIFVCFFSIIRWGIWEFTWLVILNSFSKVMKKCFRQTQDVHRFFWDSPHQEVESTSLTLESELALVIRPIKISRCDILGLSRLTHKEPIPGTLGMIILGFWVAM